MCFLWRAQRWETANSLACFFCACMLMLNGIIAADNMSLPPPKDPMFMISPDRLGAAAKPEPLVPEMPVPTYIFTMIFCGGIMGSIGALMRNKNTTPNLMALHDLEIAYPLLKGFSARYDRELAPWMEQQEKRRRQVVFIRDFSFVFCAVFFIIAAVGINFTFLDKYGPNVKMLCFLAIAGAAYLGEQPLQDFKYGIKVRLAEHLSQFLKLTYSPETNQNLHAFEELDLISVYDYSNQSDLFMGRHEAASFRMWKAELIRRGGRNKQRVTVFRGALVDITFPRSFTGTTKILRDWGFIGNALMDKLIVKEKRVGLSYSSFEKDFEVYSTDQVEARALLTPDIIENIIKLARTLSGGARFQAAFKGQHLLMAINLDGELFDLANMDLPMTDRERIKRFAEQVAITHTIIDTLDLPDKHAKGSEEKPKQQQTSFAPNAALQAIITQLDKTAAKVQEKAKTNLTSLDDFYATMRLLISDLKTAGYVQQAEKLEEVAFKTAWTTGSELLGELGDALNGAGKQVTHPELAKKIGECAHFCMHHRSILGI
jgi:hypothetical protein